MHGLDIKYNSSEIGKRSMSIISMKSKKEDGVWGYLHIVPLLLSYSG